MRGKGEITLLFVSYKQKLIKAGIHYSKNIPAYIQYCVQLQEVHSSQDSGLHAPDLEEEVYESLLSRMFCRPASDEDA